MNNRQFKLVAATRVLTCLLMGVLGMSARSPVVAQELQPMSEAEISQVTSVSQLSDVQPTDWAFQALQSLVERYGCIAGYPDGTYRGNRALTRYEFAAGLNACLDKVNELIATGTSNLASKNDLITLQRLQEEFAAELASLRGRVDALEAQTAELEANQFSTTTKLTGNIFVNVTGAFAEGDILAEGETVFRTQPRTSPNALRRVTEDPNITLSNYVFLNFTTSFTGKDSLVTQLVTGNGDSPANRFASAGLYNTLGVPYTDQTGVTGGTGRVVLRELFYNFPIGESLRVVVGPRVNWYRYFDNNRFTFYLTGAGSFNSSGSTLLNAVDRGSGAAVLWQISDRLKLNVAYLGENTEFLTSNLFNSSSNPSQGLFSPTNTLTAELTVSPIKSLNLRFLYNRSHVRAIAGQVGGAIGEPIYGFADDGFDGSIDNATGDTYAFNFDWLVTSGFGLFGRYAYGSTNIEPLNASRPNGEVNAQTIQVGAAFPDLGKEGALFTLSYLIPFSVVDGRNFLVSGGGDGGVQYEFEATYFYPLSQNIALVPAFYWIGNPNNFSGNPNIYVANLRAQFSF
ncbi:iron uptake porin [Synechocystis sp. PCC 7509]|uniref:iron uptake porin n=1 Tax=Synechocystis sp. PCC 7509 TaxID=927677 RepID=UPI0002ACAEC7|nr:iron uptake porin [Synechocystis sp. PCC 7509]